eukprot:12775593-Alexandrium_andersonii.AAC.1
MRAPAGQPALQRALRRSSGPRGSARGSWLGRGVARADFRLAVAARGPSCAHVRPATPPRKPWS